jgi:AcrR family transcriptional regulator
VPDVVKRETARSKATRLKLLEAAGEVFAAEGFRNGTIQQISERAGTNIAAVNYHFGDKEQLYGAVIDYAHRCALEHYPADREGGAATGTAEERLSAHVESFVARLFDRGRPAWHAKLMTREMVDPTPELDRLVRERISVNHARIGELVREILGAAADPETVRLSVLSIVGQCVFYRHSAPVVTRLYPDLAGGTETETRRIGAHVARFSIAALGQIRASAKSSKKGGRS